MRIPSYQRGAHGAFSGFQPQASAEQREQIMRLGGRPPASLTPQQARAAIRALHQRQSQRHRRLAAAAHAA